MPRELAIATLKNVTNNIIPAMLETNKIGDKFIDDKRLVSEIFSLSQSNTLSVNLLQAVVEADEEAKNVLSSYKAAMAQAVEYIELIRINNQRLIPKDIRAEILRHIKVDDAVCLAHLFKRCQTAPDILGHYAYALRVAANGQLRCLTYLIDTRCASIIEPGPMSGKIALHYAIENGHKFCVDALLRATNNMDYYDPAGQLLYGEYPNRPIDMLGILAAKNEQKAKAIREIVLDVFASKEGQGMLTTEKQVAEIKRTLEAQQALHSLAQNSSLQYR